jgi:hypothetical protein
MAYIKSINLRQEDLSKLLKDEYLYSDGGIKVGKLAQAIGKTRSYISFIVNEKIDKRFGKHYCFNEKDYEKLKQLFK